MDAHAAHLIRWDGHEHVGCDAPCPAATAASALATVTAVTAVAGGDPAKIAEAEAALEARREWLAVIERSARDLG